MINFCKCNNLYILNGRTAKDKSKGSCTVDYFLCSANILPFISDFYEDEF